MSWKATPRAWNFLIAAGLLILLNGCARQPAAVPVVLTKTVVSIPPIPEEFTQQVNPCRLPAVFTNRDIGRCHRINSDLLDAVNDRARRLRSYWTGLEASTQEKEE